MENIDNTLGFLSVIIALIVGFLSVGITLFNQNKTTRKENKDAHDQIGQNIKKVEGKVDEVNLFLRDYFAKKSKKDDA